MNKQKEAKKYIQELIGRAKVAQKQLARASQEEVDDIVRRIGWAAVHPKFAEKLGTMLVEESRMGYVPDKIAKIHTKVRGAVRDMKGKKSVGVVEDNKEKGLIKIAKPMGVIGALSPVTNGEATPIMKAMFALKTRNAIVIAPHPRAVQTNNMVVNEIRCVLKVNNWPEDLVIGVDPVSVEISGELLRQSDLNLATGGPGMVKAAYSSGTPSQGVGAGNAVSVIDETADLSDAADKVKRSKTFDHATSCSTENSLVIQETVYKKFIEELEKAGGYLVNKGEKQKLQETMWSKETGALNRAIVAQPAGRIAELAGIDLPKGKSFLMVEEYGIGTDHPFSGEKLSVTTALYKWKTFSEAIDLVNDITTFSGAGHSCGIHSKNEERIRKLGLHVKVSRVMIRQPQCLANSGAWTNGMPMSLTLGCGSWGGNSTSSNVTWEHLLNYTWLSYPIPTYKPTDEELFGELAAGSC
ncbi:MAG: aldehyde dehydrogenase family protein [Spirochaetia bacterium]|nr:aldehyde dehydrogenase family protein [Spirochaetia bacterium]MCF7945315.1 aldehyde dehydrogenase family protein [Spirochaetia bacterium]MCF7946598.1 aldehyde dehydrogenase family protein [Spirochaetia bacterium]